MCVDESVSVVQILMERKQLPVKQFEEEIMAAIDKNPVVIIRGATGCGKTTQVPQYILERFVKGHRASDCNIVVTQVRFTYESQTQSWILTQMSRENRTETLRRSYAFIFVIYCIFIIYLFYQQTVSRFFLKSTVQRLNILIL